MTVEPQGARGVWRRLTAAYYHFLCVVLALSVAILVIPVTLQIFSRFTHFIPHYIWTEEMARFLFVWTIMIGAMVGVREGAHFDVDVFPLLNQRAEAGVKVFVSIAILAMALVFVNAGIEFTEFAWYRISELAELPLWLIHIAWPIAGGTWLIFQGERMYDNARVLIGADTP